MELSTRFVRDILRAALACGVPEEDALADASAALRARLQKPGGRVGWGDVVRLLDRVGALLGSNARVEEFGRQTIAFTAPWALMHLVPHVVSPSRLLHIAFQFVGPAQIPHIRHTVETLAGGGMRLSLSLPSAYAGCETYFRMCVGGIRSIPTVIGYPPALVLTESIGPRGAVYEVTPPTSRTLASRVRRVFRALAGENALFEEMARQHEAMQEVFGALLRTQTELQQFMERIPDTLVVHREGVIVWANKALLDAIGYASLDELRGKRIVDFAHPVERDTVATRVTAPLDAVGAGTYRIRSASGAFRTFETSLPQAVIFEGLPARMAIARDVTERDALREQLVFTDRMSQLGFLAAGVAHEINNPLAYSLTAIERAQRALASGRIEEAGVALAIASEGAGRVRAITSDLRMFSRGAAQRREGVDVSHVLRATVDLAGASIDARAKVVTCLGPTPTVLADEARLGQVFMNLLLNALDALTELDPGSRRVEVRAFTDGAGRAVVEVEDNGRGIPPELLPRIFEPFFTTKGPRAGSGLGLAICKHIVNELGGRIEVSSPPSKGALFRVLLEPYQGDARAESADDYSTKTERQ